jgi:hypothetical protein
MHTSVSSIVNQGSVSDYRHENWFTISRPSLKAVCCHLTAALL